MENLTSSRSDLSPERRKAILFVAVFAATLVKLLLAWFTLGTNDIATWRTFADNAVRCGSCAYYLPGPYGDPFNHPPFIILFLKSIAALSPFPFWLRLPSIIADIVTVFLVSRLLPNASLALLLLLAVNPVSILVSGFHGNIDPVMIAFLLAATFFATKDRVLLAGFAFGMALNIKIVPLLFAPSFLVYIAPLKRKSAFCASAIAAVVLLSLPYLLDAREVVASVLGYRGLFTNWGLAHYANLAGLRPVHVLAKPFQYLLFGVCAIMPWYLRRRGLSLYAACACVVLAFYALTPSLALQYLAWGVPFIAALGFGRAALYYALAGSLVALQYHRWSGGQWIFADSHSVLPVTAETEFLSFALWVYCCVLLAYQFRLNARHRCAIPS